MLGQTYRNLDKIAEAISSYRQAEKLYTELGNDEWAQNSRDRLQALRG
ncbi:MAG TPA: hypothetical protein DDW76_14790 [Cyanobacteria bacterium UBA11369]|nr:hypothetical protein [Cyanobacteria bacterium UBA11371]HBE16323.1 hypothetical protein [Cyanobacteria bacterium UBA11367]HBE36092.1 hypothetical protein [Cyanobacteria bacterium UBA11368]HBE50024.1 hypothetical protein [Cyanobacteria bacterium UBA11369]